MTVEDSDVPGGQVLIYNDGGRNLRVRLDGNTVWLTQRQMAELYQITVPGISAHLSEILGEGEVDRESTVKSFRIVQREGTRDVSRSIEHYSLDAILSVGYRVRSARGTAFRQWATAQLSDLLVKGFVMDDERLKEGRTLGDHYFDELLERIRDIRASERMFYQKITDIYATSIDYDAKQPVSQEFFATVQNKMHWASHGHTAAQVIAERVDASRPHMGLTTWKNAPDGPVRKPDVTVAKNYLTEDELRELNRIVTMYLDFAEDQARRRQPMHMAEWVGRLDAFLEFNDRSVLADAGRVSHAVAERTAHAEFVAFDLKRRELDVKASGREFDTAVDSVKRIESGAPEVSP